MAVQLADGRYVMSKEEAETYAENNADVVLAISQGQFRNASDHFNRYCQFEDRDGSPDTDNLDASVIDATELTVPVVRDMVPPSSVTPALKLIFEVPSIEIPLKLVPATIASTLVVIVAVSAFKEAISVVESKLLLL